MFQLSYSNYYYIWESSLVSQMVEHCKVPGNLGTTTYWLKSQSVPPSSSTSPELYIVSSFKPSRFKQATLLEWRSAHATTLLSPSPSHCSLPMSSKCSSQSGNPPEQQGIHYGSLLLEGGSGRNQILLLVQGENTFRLCNSRLTSNPQLFSVQIQISPPRQMRETPVAWQIVFSHQGHHANIFN